VGGITCGNAYVGRRVRLVDITTGQQSWEGSLLLMRLPTFWRRALRSSGILGRGHEEKREKK
jgi:hypothetical protein